ncbi:ferritin-like domain-containing protein [Mucilaginibacter segetis]|uniref:PA2169 family four-helix-bundle protein n=1 Tax=Mucilaginibacter segetis TaxID=2793071 RepID=A0A934UM31_9SPHI|nr:PA2169 family four-helix-bundle protein [Mucilaginibacter segetis]MBK0378457.1 PA2169 family four-helix-bundle protein [Mucilaginibacter segetis]
MKTIEKSIEVLNDLIEINNDRIAGFEKAIADIRDENVDLKELFQQYSAQSRRFSQELTQLVASEGGEAETGNSAGGTLHRAWIDVKSLFSNNDRASILNEAERGEDAIKKAYKQALSEGELSVDATTRVSTQAQEINAAHDRIKALRDAVK